MNSENSEVFSPAIVVVGFNRPSSIQRLLDSISQARFPTDADVTLIISVDFSDTDNGLETKLVAENFDWKHGPKKLVFHDSNLGLRKHVLACGELSAEYGSIIMLEDDLTVGPEFYRYTKAALNFVEKDDQVGGVSLYSHKTNFICRLPFEPVFDGGENYYLQIASSWGQAWTARQWTNFKAWYNSLPVDSSGLAVLPMGTTPRIHRKIVNWPDSSWLKFFIAYLALSDRYFFYPRTAHSTNNSCSGTNVTDASHAWQVPLCLRKREFNFATLKDSLAVYDSHFEMKPGKLKEIVPSLENYQIETDLYGTKDLDAVNQEHVITSKGCNSPIKSFPIGLKPIELNLNCPCEESIGKIVLAKRKSQFSESTLNYRDKKVLEYFYGELSIKQIVKNCIRYLWR